MYKALCLILVAGLLFSCCTLNFDEKIANAEKRLQSAEARLDSLESRADSIEQRQAALEEEYAKSKPKGSSEAAAISLSNEEIQTALKNAGLYTGAIDGKMGPNTDKAIRDFQVVNGLKADGIVGAKTKSLLLKYLPQEQKTE